MFGNQTRIKGIKVSLTLKNTFCSEAVRVKAMWNKLNYELFKKEKIKRRKNNIKSKSYLFVLLKLTFR